MNAVEKGLSSIINAYDVLVKGINETAMTDTDRAYGGIIRAGKGELVESIAKNLVIIAWTDVLHQDIDRLELNKKKMPVYVKKGYENRFSDPLVRDYIIKNRTNLVYKFGTDVQVFIDGRLVMPIECKAYTENAMFKRILFDAMLMKEVANTDTYFLLQLESQLGGDYSCLSDEKPTLGSGATHALMSHVSVPVEIITLLEGERKVDRPIHKAEYYKPLQMKNLQKALAVFSAHLSKYRY